MEEELEKIKKMKALEYLDILNIKTKEKLIGLCLDKHILECLDVMMMIQRELKEIMNKLIYIIFLFLNNLKI